MFRREQAETGELQHMKGKSLHVQTESEGYTNR